MALIAGGAVHASLWLDEIEYWIYERDPAIRSVESRRPGSELAEYFFNYSYCGIQRIVHAVLRPLGLTLQRDPELFLRLMSILSLAGAAIVVYVVAFRISRDWAWSTAAAFLIGASPVLLFYAFEARVSAFATFGMIAWLALLAVTLTHPKPRNLCILGALLGIFLGHVHVYLACVYGGLCIAAVIRFLIARDRREALIIGAFAVPGILTSFAETMYIRMTYPSGHGFPLYVPRRPGELLSVTLSVFSSTGLSTPPMFFRLLSVFVLGATIAVALYTLKRSPYLVMPIAALLALIATLVIGSTYGYMIVPRYQVPLIGALLFSFAFAYAKPARICVLLLAAIELFALPGALRDTFLKGNSRPIATVIASTPREGTAVIVQHPLRLGYPDPLHSFALAFYLDEVHPALPPVRIYELPSLHDVTHAEGVLPYFDGGPELRKAFAATPATDWVKQLSAAPWQRIWLVTPVPRIDDEDAQSRAFRDALQMSGFRLQHAQLVEGYPKSQLGLFVRSGGR